MRELLLCWKVLLPHLAFPVQAWALVEKQAGRIERARELFEQGLRVRAGGLGFAWMEGAAQADMQTGSEGHGFEDAMTPYALALFRLAPSPVSTTRLAATAALLLH